MKRRAFLQRLGLVASLPLWTRAVGAADAPVAAPAVGRPHTLLSCNVRVALPEDEAGGNGWLSWRIIRDGRDGRYPSDHYFVAAELKLL